MAISFRRPTLEMKRGVLCNYNPGVEQKQVLPVEGGKDCTARKGPMGSRDGIGSLLIYNDRDGKVSDFRGDNSYSQARESSLGVKDLCSEVTSLRSCETDSKRIRASLEITRIPLCILVLPKQRS